MSSAKFSFETENDGPHVFDDAGGVLAIADRLAIFFQRPDLAEKIDKALRKSINYRDLYDVLPVSVIRELHHALIGIESASAAFMDSDCDLFPEAIPMVTSGNRDLFEAGSSDGGPRAWNVFASMARLQALKDYFQRALQRNKEIDFGKYS